MNNTTDKTNLTQDKHLPHDAWHVVHQKQGRVQPILQTTNEVMVNEDTGLEKEADVMGAQAKKEANLHTKIQNNMPTNNSFIAPKSSFVVNWDTQTNIVFQEITGLEAEVNIIEYRPSNSALFSAEQMPNIAKYGNITMKNGIFTNNDAFWTWYDKLTMNTAARTSITISLLDDTSKTTMTWTLINAWATKTSGTDLKEDGDEVAISSIEVAHEGLTITNP